MRIGVRIPFAVENITLAARLGFDCAELCLGNNLKINPTAVKDEELDALLECIGECGIKVASLSFFENFLTSNKKSREKFEKQMLAAIDLAPRLDASKVTTNVGANAEASLEENLDEYKHVFGKFAHHAKTKAVFIAIENCPHVHIDSAGCHRIGNIACSPRNFAEMFKKQPHEHIGIEYDPSHLVWLGIDYIQFIYDFKDRIIECHAKDTEILDGALHNEGIYGSSWWRYRIPGFAKIDWSAVFRALYDIGFTGNMIIEHEDPVFVGARYEEGLSIGLKYLRRFTV